MKFTKPLMVASGSKIFLVQPYIELKTQVYGILESAFF